MPRISSPNVLEMEWKFGFMNLKSGFENMRKRFHGISMLKFPTSFTIETTIGSSTMSPLLHALKELRWCRSNDMVVLGLITCHDIYRCWEVVSYMHGCMGSYGRSW